MIQVRYFGAAREAAGCPAEQFAAADLPDLARLIGKQHGEQLTAILGVATLLLDGTRHRADEAVALPDGATVDVLPPFAGG
jgi:sulfur-carrier protein